MSVQPSPECPAHPPSSLLPGCRSASPQVPLFTGSPVSTPHKGILPHQTCHSPLITLTFSDVHPHHPGGDPEKEDPGELWEFGVTKGVPCTWTGGPGGYTGGLREKILNLFFSFEKKSPLCWASPVCPPFCLPVCVLQAALENCSRLTFPRFPHGFCQWEAQARDQSEAESLFLRGH